ncbi:hypothetical protein Syun_016544 [Stephania yunnanensis]|uniref:Uncharacterized protein n=1 Tax=Stephania yunnanensis TaxID=152371 RepID=A0AAP0P1L2_9MAGN
MRVADHSRSGLLPRDGRKEERDEPVNEQGEVGAWRRGFVQAVEAMRSSTNGGNEKCVKMRKGRQRERAQLLLTAEKIHKKQHIGEEDKAGKIACEDPVGKFK